MKLILSRKGFDSASGGCPSPILPDGSMISFPIPDKDSHIRYSDITWHGYNLGTLVSELTGDRIPAHFNAHLDPDLNSESLPRTQGWRPIFGQAASSQTHLRNNGVDIGDIFLFFGLFRHTVESQGSVKWAANSCNLHVLWGWLQIDEMISVDTCDRAQYKWADYHPHFQWGYENNCVYVSKKYLSLSNEGKKINGAGVFPHFSEQLQLTARSSKNASLWELPSWFYPRDDRTALTYHGDLSRWEKTDQSTMLRSIGRGQEFVLDCEEYSEAKAWISNLIESNS